MKKLLIIIVSVILILSSVLAGTALAAKPEGTPTEEWDLIDEMYAILVDCYDSISGNFTEIIGRLIDLDDDVAAVASNVTPIYESLGSMASVNSTQGYFTWTGQQGGAFGGTGDYIGGAHHSITVHIFAIGNNDKVQIWEYYKSGAGLKIIDPPPTYLCTGRYTYETDAYRVAVYARNDEGGDDGVPLEMAWGVTTTYSADAAGY